MALITTFMRVLMLNAIDSAIKTFGNGVEVEIIIHKASDDTLARLGKETMYERKYDKHKITVYSESHLPFGNEELNKYKPEDFSK